MAKLRRIAALAAILLSGAPLLHADGARFDLTGPPIDVRITRAGVTLPIDSVPNLLPGDKIWVHPDLPDSQSVRYLLVVAFLRGTTNPPPDSWFTRLETWDKHVRTEGATVTVPDEAQQVLLFLAPVTGGDFSTLRSAVQGRPGVFVRASQDLTAAGFEQARIEKYISSLKQVPPGDPKALLQHSNLLAATLNLKPNEDCFKRPFDQQATCLTQTGGQALLDDGHGETIVSQLANGPSSDLISAASATQLAGGGMYSAYIGTVVDLVRLLSGLHTAKYQYIPAIAFPEGQSLNLRLNMPPSFLNPKSVIVIGLPSVQSTTPPPLRAADPKQVTCLLKPRYSLTVEGAPLVFSTSFAHNLVLRLNTPQPTPDIPLTANAYQGGLVVASADQRHQLASNGKPEFSDPPPDSKLDPKLIDSGQLTGTIYGMWGFDRFTGPTLAVQNVPGQGWRLVGDDPVIAGKQQQLQIAASGTGCVESVTADTGARKPLKVDWKRDNESGHIDVSLRAGDPTALHLAIHQYGQHDPETVSTEALAEPATLADLLIHAGDSTAVLRGARLDQVKQVDLNGAVFTPQPDSDSDSQLTLVSATPAGKLHPGQKLTAKAVLKDGRTLPIAATITAARPSITLLRRDIPQPASSLIQLTGKDDLPLSQTLSFSLKSTQPFSRQERLEIASPDGSLHTTLSIADGSLILQDPHTILATLDPMKAFGASAFGPLQMRPIAPDGSSGDWQPLVTLVRLPQLDTLSCPADPTIACTLTGSNLYLLSAVSASADLSSPADVPEGFLGNSLQVPHPSADTGTLYLRLRDDPANTDPATFPTQANTATTE